MVNKILKTLTNNLGLKIIAILCACSLWLVVYNLDDPTKTKSLSVNVTITNKEVLEDMGKYYEVQNGTNKVSFSITAPRSILDKLDETDFIAEANLQKVTLDDTGMTASVPIEIICTANVSENSLKLNDTNRMLQLTLEDLMVKQFVVQASATGNVAEGYALGNVEVTAPNVLRVSGPKSIVSKIFNVIATVDVSGMSDSSTTYRATPVLIGEDGLEIDTTRLTLSDTTVNVAAEILNMKQVAISVTPTGTVAEGYAITGVKTNPEMIYLKGYKNILNGISAISIPAGIVSVEGATEDVTVTVDVSEYIPDGVELAMLEQASVEIKVSIDKVKSKSYNINTEDIVVTGLPNRMALEYALSSVAVDITGLEKDINALANDAVVASLDVTNLEPGTHEVDLVLDLDENKYTYESIKVVITIVEDAGDEPPADDSTSDEAE